MASAERPPEPMVMTSIEPTAPPPPLPGDEQSRYPWKRQIVTTTFWVGETPTKNNPVPNDSSCWDPHWARNYGGNDTPDTSQRTAEYIPANFTPGQNPFYVALPYNDMENGAHKAEAPRSSRGSRGITKALPNPSAKGAGSLSDLARRFATPNGRTPAPSVPITTSTSSAMNALAGT